MPLDQLRQAAGELVVSGIRSSSQQTYSYGQNLYCAFCQVYGLRAMPATEDILMMFVTYMFLCKGLKYDTIHVYLYSVRSMHIEHGYYSPLDNRTRLDRVLRAVKLQQGDSKKRKLAFTLELLIKVKCFHDTQDHDKLVLWSAMTTAHFGFLRCAEFTVANPLLFDVRVNLCVADVAITNGEYMNIVLKRSKTDPFKKGITVTIGCTGQDVCAVCTMKSLLIWHYERKSDPSTPLFLMADHLPLTRSRFISHIRWCLARVGVDPSQYSGHSMRIGGATTAAAAGFSDWEIKLMGRWRSQVYQTYIRAPPSLLAGFASRMVKTTYFTNMFTYHRPYDFKI